MFANTEGDTLKDTGFDWTKGPAWSVGPAGQRRLVRPQRSRASLIAALAIAMFAAATVTIASAATDAQTMYPCVGAPADAPRQTYPEPRVYLESQIWTTPQPIRAGYAGSGVTGMASGHTHVGTCFPLLQHLRGNVLQLDVHIQAHNMTQPIDYGLRVDAYDVLAWIDHASFSPPKCLVGTTCFQPMDCKAEQCDQWVHVDFPLKDVPVSGFRSFYIFPMSNWLDGSKQWTNGTWWAYIDNGKPAGTAPQPVDPLYLAGQGEFTRPNENGGKYARAQLPMTEYPYDPATGHLKAVSGTWTIHPREEGQRLGVYVDPMLHAHPMSLGTIAHQSLDTSLEWRSTTVNIDTTKLTNGVHFLLIAAGKIGKGVEWTGVLKVPFLVENPTAPLTTTDTGMNGTTMTGTTSTTTTPTTPTTTSAPTTTSTTTDKATTTPPTSTTTSIVYQPACEPACDQQIADLKAKIAQADSILMKP